MCADGAPGNEAVRKHTQLCILHPLKWMKCSEPCLAGESPSSLITRERINLARSFSSRLWTLKAINKAVSQTSAAVSKISSVGVDSRNVEQHGKGTRYILHEDLCLVFKWKCLNILIKWDIKACFQRTHLEYKDTKRKQV